MNKKGFTLVEILAAVAILGILSLVAIAGYSKYIDFTKKKGYQVMARSVSTSSEEYVMDFPGLAVETEKVSVNGAERYVIKDVETATAINLSDLVDRGYLSNLTDPGDKDKKCNGTVVIGKVKGEMVGALDQYIYKIDLCCQNYQAQYLYTLEVRDGKMVTVEEIDQDNISCGVTPSTPEPTEPEPTDPEIPEDPVEPENPDNPTVDPTHEPAGRISGLTKTQWSGVAPVEVVYRPERVSTWEKVDLYGLGLRLPFSSALEQTLVVKAYSGPNGIVQTDYTSQSTMRDVNNDGFYDSLVFNPAIYRDDISRWSFTYGILCDYYELKYYPISTLDRNGIDFVGSGAEIPMYSAQATNFGIFANGVTNGTNYATGSSPYDDDNDGIMDRLVFQTPANEGSLRYWKIRYCK